MRFRLLSVSASSMVVLACISFALAGSPVQQGLQERLAAVKAGVAQNKAQLATYEWIETQQVALKGDVKSTKQNACHYGPDGTVQKTPIGPPQPPPGSGGGRLKQRIVQNKVDDIEQYMEQVKGLLSLYVPPDAQHMQQAAQAGNVSLGTVPGGGVALVFKNYAQQGDQYTMGIDPATHKVSSANVNTYLGDPSSVVTLAVQFALLPDGTSYPAQTVLNATSKQITVTITNSGYQKIGGQ